jgi:hypothetical protein
VTKNEKELTIKMLGVLSDILGDRCCNDFSFPESWSKDEVTKFVKDYHDWNGDPEEFSEEDLNLPDFGVVSLLSERLKAVQV